MKSGLFFDEFSQGTFPGSPSRPSQQGRKARPDLCASSASLVVKSQLPPRRASRLSCRAPTPIPPSSAFAVEISRSRALARPRPRARRHGDAEPDAALPQVSRRAAPRPLAGRGAVVVRRGRGRRRRAGDRDGLAAALRPPLRAPQHRRPLRLQVPQPPNTLSHLG